MHHMLNIVTRGGLVLAILLGFLVTVPAGAAENVMEVWRSPFGLPYSVSVNPTDGSCWAATGSLVTHVAADGAVMSETHGFRNPLSVSANPVDGSCWVADTVDNQVVQLAADGTEVWRGDGFLLPISVSVNPTDGSCWVADFGASEVVHLDAAGAELWRGSGFSLPECVSVNVTDGSCWVADTGNDQVAHLDAAGGELWRGGAFSLPLWVSVSSSDGSCWMADWGNGELVHLAEDGTELARTAGEFSEGEGPVCVSVNPNDGSCWTVGGWDRGHVAADGTILFWTPVDADEPWCISVDPADGSYWTGYYGNARIAHRRANSGLIWQGGYLNLPAGLSVNRADNSCWATDNVRTMTNGLFHLAEDGTEVWRLAGKPAYGVQTTSVNPTNGSCWVANTINYGVFHVGADGSWLWAGAPNQFWDSLSVSVNPADGSCWAADSDAWHRAVVHLAEDGAELWRSTPSRFSYPQSVSVNATDGSCWVADYYGSRVVHLAADGTELWRGGGVYHPAWVSANAADNSCWAADYGHSQVVHLAEDGTELWRSPAGMFAGPTSVSVNTTNGSCWVTDRSHDQIVHLAADGTELWRGGGFNYPWAVSVNEADGSCWVADTGNAQVVHLVIVSLPDADFSADVTAGTAPLTVSFTDLSTNDPTSWSWDFGDGGSSTEQHPSHTYTSAGSFTVSLTATNDAGSDTATKADYITVVQTWFEDDDPEIIYTGTWTNYAHAAASDGHAMISSETEARATFTFTGTGIKWRLAKGPQMGKAKAYLDGAGPLVVDLYSSTLKLVTLSKTGLTPGTHTLRVEVAGQKNPSSRGYVVDIDALEVAP
jgi:PKD repeat protein